ncbi:rod shape-determining protein RodA [Capnocytophaga canimorsus]|uniref:Rod shape-determining protein rodA n=2 Tax=Capnocytophaga canimorsus TaxID=28188 RepID=F9YUP4_CAPCC|nr:rod shape-determining protein RodA [Capnocytophaga canimorsus]AEK24281.1 Rod shape-determining protein rodA [Capnocytophaga canimorsus Cc5]ATA77191.1 rod shape-determining protein RodA [Capnocytophaga canimorsus]ATA91797.1 rod shape-determining protein RodA [Capnocytophaga canimorsus]ATA93942.1 rod shape-determining protein RodA [Capnocytophaga canimorsus]PJI83660.1 rod shape determining protein RodA [Capnocytophaga canimorsus]
MKQNVLKNLDWICIICYLLLVTIGWITIYSTTVTDPQASVFNLNFFYGKQLLFIGLSVLLIIFILAVDSKFFENFSTVFYIVSLVLLAGLFLFGKKINGSLSWYAIGPITFQPSEFAKVATALFFAKYLSNIHTDISRTKDLVYAVLILAIPGGLIILQPDAGSLLVFFSLIFVLHREGMSLSLLFYLLLGGLVFVTTLKFGIPITLLISAIGVTLYVLLIKKRTKKIPFFNASIVTAICVITTLATPFVFDSVMKQHHRNRFSLWLSLEDDPVKLAAMRRDFGYNSYMSESAMTAGGIYGKGFLEGTRTKGGFVPEQHTDYIFTSLGEEWGLIGTISVVLLFSFLLLRLIVLAEKQRSNFSRIYGYCVASILFIHFLVNIGMVIGLIPTIGIPLPFFSYGGSGLWAFTILLFIFLRLDANRIHDWIN